MTDDTHTDPVYQVTENTDSRQGWAGESCHCFVSSLWFPSTARQFTDIAAVIFFFCWLFSSELAPEQPVKNNFSLSGINEEQSHSQIAIVY